MYLRYQLELKDSKMFFLQIHSAGHSSTSPLQFGRPEMLGASWTIQKSTKPSPFVSIAFSGIVMPTCFLGNQFFPEFAPKKFEHSKNTNKGSGQNVKSIAKSPLFPEGPDHFGEASTHGMALLVCGLALGLTHEAVWNGQRDASSCTNSPAPHLELQQKIHSHL